jgi:hypothetical protein
VQDGGILGSGKNPQILWADQFGNESRRFTLRIVIQLELAVAIVS